jgi:hypothetical protein
MGKHHGDDVERRIPGRKIGRKVVLIVEGSEGLIANAPARFDVSRLSAADVNQVFHFFIRDSRQYTPRRLPVVSRQRLPLSISLL